MKSVMAFVLRSSKRLAVSVVGFALVAVGLVMIVTPGPGLIVVIAGLAVLGSEYAWARRALRSARERAARARTTVTRRRHGPPTTQ